MTTGAGAWQKPRWYGMSTVGHGITLGDGSARDGIRIRNAAKGIETELRNQGYLPDSTVPDGIFYNKTDQAIRDFQRRHGLVADGQVGPKTAAALFKPVVLWEQVAGRVAIPLNALHGIIMLESAYDPGAEGVRAASGIDRGIAQLNSEVYSFTAPFVYANPRTCISIAATRLREARRRESDELSYADKGNWDCAILDHNWPVAADYKYDTGEWLLTEEEREAKVLPQNGRAATYVRLVRSRGATF